MDIDSERLLFNYQFVGKKIKKICWQKPSAAGDNFAGFSSEGNCGPDYFATGSWDDRDNNEISIWRIEQLENWKQTPFNVDSDQTEKIDQDGKTFTKMASFLCSGDVTDLRFFTWDKLLYSSSDGDLTLLQYNQATNHLKRLNRWTKIHNGSISGFSVFGEEVVTVGEDGQLNVVNIHRKDNKSQKLLAANSNSAQFYCIDHFGSKEVVAGNAVGQLWMCDLRQNESTDLIASQKSSATQTLPPIKKAGGVTAVRCHPSRRHLVVAGHQSGDVVFWDLRGLKSSTNKPVGPAAALSAHCGPVWDVKFHQVYPDNIFTASNDGCLIHWDVGEVQRQTEILERKFGPFCGPFIVGLKILNSSHPMVSLMDSLQFSSLKFLSNAKEQARVLEFFDNLKNSTGGWRSCIDAVAINSMEDQLKFFCLQVVEHYIKTGYFIGLEEDRKLIHGFLTHWLNQISGRSKLADSYFLRNKMAQLFSLVFLVDFPQKWPSFIQEVFLNTLNLDNEPAVEFFLLILIQIDAEISDREVPRSKEVSDRNTSIRDNMRILCITDLVEFWYKILTKYVNLNAKITSSCLHCLCGYVVWIDINFVANERFVPLIVDCLKNSPTHSDDLVSVAASDCLCSILNKGMDVPSKLSLLQAMDKMLHERGVYGINEQDADSVSRLAEIVTCMGSILIDCYNKVSKSLQLAGLSQDILTAMESKLNLILMCLVHNEISISTYAAEFCHEYVVVLKQMTPLTWKHREFLDALLSVLMRRFKFPPDYDHEHEGENEIEFLDFRKELKTIFTNIALVDLRLAIDFSEKLVLSTFSNWSQSSYTDIELAISLLHVLGEVLQFNQGSAMVSSDEGGLRLKRMVHLMITSGVSNQKHPAVCLQYFETVCRYDKLIAMEPALIPDAITSFLDDRGLHHVLPRVRSRSVYLFSKFIRLQKASVQNHVDQILLHLQDLLQLSPKITNNLITNDDQLFLFETIGILIVSGTHSNEEKRRYMQLLLGSLADRFNEALAILKKTSDEKEKRILIDFLNYLMAYASRTSKAFSNQITMASCLCDDIFLQLLKVFIESLQPSTDYSPPLLTGLRQYLHRMVISLGNEILPYFPGIIQRFLAIINDSRLLQDFLTLLQQAIIKYKLEFVKTCKDDIPLIFATILNVLSQPVDTNDEVASRDSLYLRRAYHQLLSAMAKNNLTEMWSCLQPADLDILLKSISDGALMVTEPTVQKLSFSTVQRCLENHQNAAKASAELEMDSWLFNFFYYQILPACFIAPLKVGFDYADAQAIMVISEIGALLRQFYEIRGDQLIDYISRNLWPEAKLPIEYLNELCFAIKTMDLKAFQKYIRTFFENLSKIVKYD